ncbi:Protein of unknown function [Pyronema omphalodes CBS 100304]|uniref:Uncharacterized protein n=1 Tax=Pyronema omphalodes (strain CBS 100304) TaxID=1076935 RepID=U4LA60_PYROM|nr:Protein of unknown function [Pyronema omphalodes CBS 100304]
MRAGLVNRNVLLKEWSGGAIFSTDEESGLAEDHRLLVHEKKACSHVFFCFQAAVWDCERRPTGLQLERKVNYS